MTRTLEQKPEWKLDHPSSQWEVPKAEEKLLVALRKKAEHHIYAAEDARTRFIQEINNCFWSAMEWSQEEFEAAARLRVWSNILNSLDSPNVTAQFLYKTAIYHVRGSANRSRSTSPCADLMRNCIASVWNGVAEFLEELGINEVKDEEV